MLVNMLLYYSLDISILSILMKLWQISVLALTSHRPNLSISYTHSLSDNLTFDSIIFQRNWSQLSILYCFSEFFQISIWWLIIYIPVIYIYIPILIEVGLFICSWPFGVGVCPRALYIVILPLVDGWSTEEIRFIKKFSKIQFKI